LLVFAALLGRVAIVADETACPLQSKSLTGAPGTPFEAFIRTLRKQYVQALTYINKITRYLGIS
jgi:hypothetical protein